MNLEETLSNLGENPLSCTPHARQIKAFLNGMLNAAGGELVTLSTPADKILTLIYGLADTAKQERILGKEYKGVRNSDTYRHVVLCMSATLVAIALSVSFSVVMNEGPMDDATGGLLKAIVLGVFELIKQSLSG
jgi:hypothetical protein